MIAVVDDDPSVMDALRNLLESAGYQVLSYSSGRQFLDQGAVDSIACLISDIGMPEIDGLKLQAAVGRLRPELPVILITGREDAGNQGVLAANNKGFFRKPFDMRLLLNLIESLLQPAGGPPPR